MVRAVSKSVVIASICTNFMPLRRLSEVFPLLQPHFTFFRRLFIAPVSFTCCSFLCVGARVLARSVRARMCAMCAFCVF